MAFSKDDYLGLINDTLAKITSSDNSIFSQAQNELKTFLEQQTSITDNEKAQAYAQFLTQLVTTSIESVVTSATQISLQKDEVAQRIASMQAEDAIKKAQSDKDLTVKDQQIASMKAHDSAENSRVAGELSDIKYKIETYYPAQVNAINADISYKNTQTSLVSKEIQVKEAQIAVEKNQAENVRADINLKQAQLKVEQEEIQLKQAQIPVFTAQATTEQARSSLLYAQATTEQANANLIKANTALTDANIGKIGVESKLLTAETQTQIAEANLKTQQATAVLQALDVNKEIERCKCETQLKIASIQAETL